MDPEPSVLQSEEVQRPLAADARSALGWSSPCCGQQCMTGNDPWAWMRVPRGGPEGEGWVNPRGALEPRLLSSRITIIKRYITQTLIKPHQNKGLCSALVSM